MWISKTYRHCTTTTYLCVSDLIEKGATSRASSLCLHRCTTTQHTLGYTFKLARGMSCILLIPGHWPSYYYFFDVVKFNCKRAYVISLRWRTLAESRPRKVGYYCLEVQCRWSLCLRRFCRSGPNRQSVVCCHASSGRRCGHRATVFTGYLKCWI